MTDVVGSADASSRHLDGLGSTNVDHTLGDWLRLCGAGDDVAFARIYDATASRAYGLALRVLGDPFAAEDVVQESYLHVWSHSARFDPGRGRAVSWILMVVHGRAVSRIRSEAARTSREDRAGRRDHPSESVARDETHHTVAASIEAQRVRELVARIPVVQRTAVELAYFDGHTYAEVARLTDVPLGTAKTRIRAGLRSLRELLDLPRGLDRPPDHHREQAHEP